MSVKDVVRARIKARIAAQNHPAPEPPPTKTKAEIQDELTAAGIEYPKDARKPDLEALLAEPRIAPDYAESAE